MTINVINIFLVSYFSFQHLGKESLTIKVEKKILDQTL